MLLDSNMFLWTVRFLEYVYLQGSADWEVIRSIYLGIVVFWLLVAQSLSLLTVALKFRHSILGLGQDVVPCYEQF